MATPEETVGVPGGPEPCEEPIEVYWQIRSRSGWVLQCAIFQSEIGLVLRVCDDENIPISTTPVTNVEEGRTRAMTLRRILLEDGEFEEVGEGGDRPASAE
jgi:hypothetical protein